MGSFFMEAKRKVVKRDTALGVYRKHEADLVAWIQEKHKFDIACWKVEELERRVVNSEKKRF